MMRRRRRNPGGFWPWAEKHWIIAGFILLPALISVPVAIVRALNPPPTPPVPHPLDFQP